MERTTMQAASGTPAIDNDLLPIGDVPLAPIGLTGMSEAELARAMATQVAGAPGAEAEALGWVRSAFADSPLAFRLGALAALMHRG
jgi:hypothetical protein